MTNTEHKEKMISTIKELVNIIPKQIFSEDKTFLLNMRIVCEGLMYINFDVETKYTYLNLNDFEREKKLKECKLKSNNNLWELAKIFSKYLHFSLKEEYRELNKQEVKDLIKKINEEIKKSPFKEIPPIPIDNKNIPSKILIQNNQIALKENKLKEILDTNYNIPMYQRRFSWSNVTLIEMIKSIFENGNTDLGIYYLTDKKELIDGQQRIHALYMINQIICIHFPLKAKEALLTESTVEIIRERSTEECWRGNFKKFQKQIQNSNNKKSELHEIYIKIKEIIDSYPIEQVGGKFRSVSLNLKKIPSKDGVLYFEKINDGGKPLAIFEKIFAVWIRKNTSTNFKNRLYNVWSKIDENIHRLENSFEFLENFFLIQRDKIEDLEDKTFIDVVEALSKILFNDKENQEMFLFRLGTKINLKERNKEYHNLLLEELIIRSNNQGQEAADQKVIKKIFLNNKNSTNIKSINFNTHTINYLFSILSRYSIKYDFSFVEDEIINYLSYNNNFFSLGNNSISEEEYLFISKISNNEHEGFFKINGSRLITNINTKNTRNDNYNDILPLLIYNRTFEIFMKFINGGFKNFSNKTLLGNIKTILMGEKKHLFKQEVEESLKNRYNQHHPIPLNDHYIRIFLYESINVIKKWGEIILKKYQLLPDGIIQIISTFLSDEDELIQIKELLKKHKVLDI